MKYDFLVLSFLLTLSCLCANDTNSTTSKQIQETNSTNSTTTFKQTREINGTTVTKGTTATKELNASAKKKKIEAEIKAQMKREEKYAKERRFYQGDDYDLKAHEVDPNALPDVPIIEPEDDFDITDVYRDDI